ncbi:Ferritin-like metal-binding protein YciE [Granulicella pectinivorans]|jgi:ferritin-like metal-binding protein YciE|uniref:Ferritin-like metal-binding protein YciE n=1 Tax=Granulicella pectinivorans TaxID=474950 RepID=A0A1I6LGX8_9BACT|nr:ferritin-like domain-containing protein [Granulicella pectinivorans]SFS02721.1 Ferritin-like metal-binding protein YciE [Granulicella pectinivorans]
MSLQDVFLEELRDLYSAENQLVKALPKMAKATKTESLKTAFTNHLEETKGQVERLKQAFQILGKKPTGQHCNGMEGVVEEGKDAIESDEEGATKDVELIGAALRVEHYEIAGYTAAIAIAKSLGQKEIAALLNANLQEEVAAGKLLLGESKPALAGAASAKDATKAEKSDTPKTAKERESKKKSEQDQAAAAPALKKSAKA